MTQLPLTHDWPGSLQSQSAVHWVPVVLPPSAPPLLLLLLPPAMSGVPPPLLLLPAMSGVPPPLLLVPAMSGVPPLLLPPARSGVPPLLLLPARSGTPVFGGAMSTTPVPVVMRVPASGAGAVPIDAGSHEWRATSQTMLTPQSASLSQKPASTHMPLCASQ